MQFLANDEICLSMNFFAIYRKCYFNSGTCIKINATFTYMYCNNCRTVVTVNIGKSQALHTTILRKGKEHNSAMVSIGEIDINIPQHPVVLHDMMARGTRQLSTTLQEFRRPVSRAR